MPFGKLPLCRFGINEKKHMITHQSIIEFFDQETIAEKKRYDELMALSLAERVRKRKAIRGLHIDKDYEEESPDGEHLYRLTVGINLADFKEGDRLRLHKEDSDNGVACTLYRFEGDNAILISVSSYNLYCDIRDWHGVALVLDKDNVDLRKNVYSPFTTSLDSGKEYWEKNILNTKQTPVFENISRCEKELANTEECFHLKFTPRQREAILRSMEAKDYYLIQGPPGTGKSFVLGWIILEELLFFKRKVVVVGPNHLAINNALEQVVKSFPGIISNVVKVGQSYNAPSLQFDTEKGKEGIKNVQRLNCRYVNDFDGPILLGMTPHCLYTSRARDLDVDVLVIDEAGQMPIPLALMGMIKANKVIMAGDHKQLPPIVVSDKIPEELKASVFQRIMTPKNATLLDTSFRMRGVVCDFVSDLFYESKVKAQHKENGTRIMGEDALYSFGHPVILQNVEDQGEQSSDKEAAFIANTIAGFMERGLSGSDIAVLSPFRAQAANIRKHIRKSDKIQEEGKACVAVDTIDKMQGQEREVVIVSLVAGNPDYMDEIGDFLYNPNKLNVAFSRAKSKLIVVGNWIELALLDSDKYPLIQRILDSRFAEKTW